MDIAEARKLAQFAALLSSTQYNSLSGKVFAKFRKTLINARDSLSGNLFSIVSQLNAFENEKGQYEFGYAITTSFAQAQYIISMIKHALPDVYEKVCQTGLENTPLINFTSSHHFDANEAIDTLKKFEETTPRLEAFCLRIFAVEVIIKGIAKCMQVHLNDDGEAVGDEDYTELDPTKPLVLLLGNIDHEGILSSLAASKRQYKKKVLESTPKNWETIINYFDEYPITAVLAKLSPQTFRLLGSKDYETVRDQLFSRIAEVSNMVFVYENLLTGKNEEDSLQGYRPYPPKELMESVLLWFEPYQLEIIPYKKNAEVTVLAESFLLDTQNNLIFRLYIPSNRIWSAEADRFLQLFRDYLDRVEQLSVRLDQRRTNQGIIYEFHGDELKGDLRLQNELEEFSHFMELCSSDPSAAEVFLEGRAVNHREVISIVSRYSKEAKRLQVDLKHERERKVLGIRQRLETELIDIAPSLEDWNAINTLIEAAIPLIIAPSKVMALDNALLLNRPPQSLSNFTINVRPQIIQTVNGVVAQEIYGDQHLTQEDQKLLELIQQFGGSKSKELESAVNELADDSAPQSDRLGAKQKIKKFLIEVGKRTTDVAVGVLQTYIEKKLGF